MKQQFGYDILLSEKFGMMRETESKGGIYSPIPMDKLRLMLSQMLAFRGWKMQFPASLKTMEIDGNGFLFTLEFPPQTQRMRWNKVPNEMEICLPQTRWEIFFTQTHTLSNTRFLIKVSENTFLPSPLYNIHSDGRICWGENTSYADIERKLGITNKNYIWDLRGLGDIQNLFFATPFTYELAGEEFHKEVREWLGGSCKYKRMSRAKVISFTLAKQEGVL